MVLPWENPKLSVWCRSAGSARFSLGFVCMISIGCLHRAPDFSCPGSCQRGKGWGGGDVLPGHEPATFASGLISMGEARLEQRRPVLGEVPPRRTHLF